MLTQANTNQCTESAQDRFYDAAIRGDLDTLKKLLIDETTKIDVNYKDPTTGMTAFHRAIYHGHIDIVKYLLDRDDIEPNITTNAELSPLHLAAISGQVEIAKLLLIPHRKLICDPNIKTGANLIPLHLASMKNRIDIAKLLIEAGADTSIKFQDNMTPLDTAVKFGNHELSMLLDGAPQNMASSLIQRMKVLGYHSDSLGICYGLAEVAIIAALTSDTALDNFYKTIFLLKRLKANEVAMMKVDHEKMTQQAEHQALVELHAETESELNRSEKIQFRALALKHLKLIRNALTPEEQEREQQYIDILGCVIN